VRRAPGRGLRLRPGDVYDPCVPRYVVERAFSRISDEEMLAASVRSLREASEHFPGITWEHSHVCMDGDGGVTTFCVYGAPDEQTVRDHAAAFGGHTIVRIYEILEDVTPDDIRRRAAVPDTAAQQPA
jgi:hypothetical protein